SEMRPQRTLALAAFMHRVGANRPVQKTWRDYFCDDPATAQGS
ncbi:ABC transporter substrate-binding protein, partial [Burkholderia pseudomallei]|nr:ABC transporter substrate-binding protein [Burkholderia pseudomallei]